MAQIAQNVYDTPTGKHLLIPQGSRLVGSYSSDVAYGQARVLVAWQRIVFPDGKAMDIGTMPGADSAGYAGFNDQVNNHYLRVFGSAFLMSGVIAAVSYEPGEQRFHRQSAARQRCHERSTWASAGQQVIAQLDFQESEHCPDLGDPPRLSLQRHRDQGHDVLQAVPIV
jgi:type IV secretory pathway VirB10-like protein